MNLTKRPGLAGTVAAFVLLLVLSVAAGALVQAYQINKHEHLLCEYFLAEATSRVTLNKTSAFGVTDIVNARATAVKLGCIVSLPHPSPDLVILAREFHIPIPSAP